LAQAGGWIRIAEQSTLSETLDALALMNIKQLDAAVRAIWRCHSATRKCDWRVFLWLDFDLSGLLNGKQAEGSTKGTLAAKNARGRQLARVSAAGHHETLWSNHNIEHADDGLACACFILNEVRVEIIEHGHCSTTFWAGLATRIFGKIRRRDEKPGKFMIPRLIRATNGLL
jgi:hypothetical protein